VASKTSGNISKPTLQTHLTNQEENNVNFNPSISA